MRGKQRQGKDDGTEKKDMLLICDSVLLSRQRICSTRARSIIFSTLLTFYTFLKFVQRLAPLILNVYMVQIYMGLCSSMAMINLYVCLMVYVHTHKVNFL